MDSKDPKAWLAPRQTLADFSDPRWEKYEETGHLLGEFYEQISGFKLPSSTPSVGFLFGDEGLGTVAHAATAIWLCKYTATLFKEVANTLGSRSSLGRPDLAKLTQDIVGILKVETRYLPDKLQLDLLAQLMVSIGVGLLPVDTDWSQLLRELFNLQFESTSGSGHEKTVMRWAIDIEIENARLTLNEREQSFRELIDAHRSEVGYWKLNLWAYLLLRLELYRPATPMAKEAMSRSNSSDSMDTYGWALFYEGDFDQAQKLLSEAVAFYTQGSPDWCEVQYHRFQVAFWSKRLSDARMLIEELQSKAPDDYWTKKATELASLVGKAIEYYSCFISYSSKNQDFAERLHDDLQAKGVRCWFAPEDLKIGDKFRTRIDEAIHIHDKLLLVLSEHSVNSKWVEKEVETAFDKETPDHTVLFPIRLDEAVMKTDRAWAADIRRTRHIGDFSNWKDHDAYQKAFDRLLRDLKAESAEATE